MNAQSVLLAAALAGCSADNVSRLSLEQAAAQLSPLSERVEPVLVRRYGDATHARTDTLVWTDSAVRGDTTFLSRGRAISTVAIVTDSQWIRLAPPFIAAGVPFGLLGGIGQPYTEGFTLTFSSETPATLPVRIASARSKGLRMVITLTGGARANYLTDGVFDRNKWKARMDRFDTPELRSLVARAVADGILIGNSVMDEPFNIGGAGNQQNGWGPPGTMTKARVDSLCGYARTIFPTLPEGVFQDYRIASGTSYRVCDFITSQYRSVKASLTDYRDGALALCRRDGHACAFAINVLDGGIPVERVPGQTNYASGDCPLTTTGGRGTYFPNCRMTAAQVREAGMVLGPAGCFLTGFRYDSSFVASSANQTAFRDIADTLASKPAASCVR